jgi:hypothetical protein
MFGAELAVRTCMSACDKITSLQDRSMGDYTYEAACAPGRLIDFWGSTLPSPDMLLLLLLLLLLLALFAFDIPI